MKTIRKTTIRLPAPGDDFPMTYALCQDDDGAFTEETLGGWQKIKLV